MSETDLWQQFVKIENFLIKKGFTYILASMTESCMQVKYNLSRCRFAIVITKGESHFLDTPKATFVLASDISSSDSILRMGPSPSDAYSARLALPLQQPEISAHWPCHAQRWAWSTWPTYKNVPAARVQFIYSRRSCMFRVREEREKSGERCWIVERGHPPESKVR